MRASSPSDERVSRQHVFRIARIYVGNCRDYAGGFDDYQEAISQAVLAGSLSDLGAVSPERRRDDINV